VWSVDKINEGFLTPKLGNFIALFLISFFFLFSKIHNYKKIRYCTPNQIISFHFISFLKLKPLQTEYQNGSLKQMMILISHTCNFVFLKKKIDSQNGVEKTSR